MTSTTAALALIVAYTSLVRADVVYSIAIGSAVGPETALPAPVNGIHIIDDAALAGFSDWATVHIYDTTGSVDESTGGWHNLRDNSRSCHRLCRCSERQCLWFARGGVPCTMSVFISPLSRTTCSGS